MTTEPQSESAPKSPIGEVDLHLFNEGTHSRRYEKLGAHPMRGGTHFAVWAPNAARVSVIGDFNDWTPGRHRLHARGASGIWEGVLPGVRIGSRYKFHIVARNGYEVAKCDPFARRTETPPRTAAEVWRDDYSWADGAWMRSRAERAGGDRPMSIYEVHLGSWRRVPEEGNRSLSYREAAPLMARHLEDLGFTHVELLPIMEHPFYGSWGYQTTGYFAPTARYGTPDDLKYFIDYLHQRGLGVILDWVPSHFPTDEHGIGYFDGTHLFEHADPKQGYHPDWKSAIYNYGRNEVRSFLLSSAHYWLEEFHADGLRVDAVASMLYLDYSRSDGGWIPNRYGGRENIEAIEFLRQLNHSVRDRHDGVVVIAEESTAWPGVTRREEIGGLGFDYKWDMGWMHDTLEYFSRDPIHRRFHQDKLTFRGLYAHSERYLLPLSHDEVVHGKGSLIGKMPGDAWQRRANLRALYAYMFTLQGKKLLFMGGEMGQWREWNHESSVDWHLVDTDEHGGLMRCLGDLARLYRDRPALHVDCDGEGFAWIDCTDAPQSVLAYQRRGAEGEIMVVVCNFTPVVRHNYRIGVPVAGRWREVLNTDAKIYGGSGQGNLGEVESAPVAMHGHFQSLNLTLPPLGVVIFEPVDPASS